MADPDSPDGSPQISTTITAVITLPEEMNFNVEVNRVKASSDIYYKKKKMGELNIEKWQEATSKRINGTKDDPPLLVIESSIKDAPIDITDEDVFTTVVQELLFGSEPLMLSVNALVDVELDTALGVLTVPEIPATGKVPVKRGFGL